MATSRLWLLLAVVPLLAVLRTRRGPARTKIIQPETERVVLLGASSGVGRDLAHAYAKRGAKICLVARRKDALETVKQECVSLGLNPDRILLVPASVTSVDDLVSVREAVVKAWGGLDTLHILAGVPSTSTLLQLAGTKFEKAQEPKGDRRFEFTSASASGLEIHGEETLSAREGLERVAVEARACAEINFVGTAIALACFIPLLASTSRSPALHHLSSVAATIAAPSRAIYSATKSAALMVVESCRVECEGSGIRFFSLLPGTIANDFRTKTATAGTGGRDETKMAVQGDLTEGLLLPPSKVLDTIMYHLDLPTGRYPLIPYPPFSFASKLSLPPKSKVFLPFAYRVFTWLGDTPLGYLFVEPMARKKYALPN